MSIWNGTDVPAKPWADDAEAKYGWDFVACLHYNPTTEFKADDVAGLDLLSVMNEDSGEPTYFWKATLEDGREFHVEGWHDYTGWDCRSGAEYKLMPTGVTV